MDLGLDLHDDSLFELLKEDRKLHTNPQSFKLRNCSPLWFWKRQETDAEFASNIMKYRGDHSYNNQHYDTALEFYQKCLDLVTCRKSAMWREVEEGKIRCLVKLQRFTEAIDISSSLLKSVNNFEQATAALYLMQSIYAAMGNYDAERNAVMKLLVLHPYNARLWYQLGNLWMATTGASSVTDCSASGFASDLSATNANTNSPAMLGLDESHTQHFSPPSSSCAPDSVSKERCIDVVSDHQQSVRSASLVTDSGIILDKYQVPASDVSTCTPTTSVSHTSNRFESRCSGAEDGNERLDSSEDWLKAYCCSRLLLHRFLTTSGSFHKDLEERLLKQVNKQLDLLQVSPSMLDLCSAQCQQSLNNVFVDESDNAGRDEVPVEILQDLPSVALSFEKRWFCWTQNVDYKKIDLVELTAENKYM